MLWISVLGLLVVSLIDDIRGLPVLAHPGIIRTDATWQVSGDGPIREADLLMGESYDARSDSSHWSHPSQISPMSPMKPMRRMSLLYRTNRSPGSHISTS